MLDVVRPDDADDRELVLRLTEIGFVPGEAVRIVASGIPGREPLAVRLGHTTFALRRHEAALIHVTPGSPTMVEAVIQGPGRLAPLRSRGASHCSAIPTAARPRCSTC